MNLVSEFLTAYFYSDLAFFFFMGSSPGLKLISPSVRRVEVAGCCAVETVDNGMRKQGKETGAEDRKRQRQK